MGGTVLDQPWERALEQEWLVTDGRGGYASGTVVGPHTRRYHGLLVAPLQPPLGRTVLLSKLEETLEIGSQEYHLSANEFHDGTVHPRGERYLRDFRLVQGVPRWRYAAGGTELVKQVWMEHGHTTTFIAYTLAAGGSGANGAIRLSLIPLCNYRDFHHETTGSEDWRFRIEPAPGGLTVRAFGGASPYHLLVLAPEGRSWSFLGQGGWWWRFLHRAERERGLDYLEDLYAAGRLICELRAGETLLLAATIEEPAALAARLGGLRGCLPPDSGMSPEQERATQGVSAEGEPFVAQLRRAANQFLVARTLPGAPAPVEPAPRATGGGVVTVVTGEALPPRDEVARAGTVLAGYHWFGDWGRDTMIALAGLTQATGRVDEAQAILRSFAQYVGRGMLPNVFPESGAPLGEGHYNTVDATLWYFHAIDVVDRLAGGGLVEALFPVLAEIVEWHVWGTRYGIRADPQDGLLRVEDGQLTWMDAKVRDWVVTPRAGKPVEIAALWHHALVLMEGWSQRVGRGAASVHYRQMRQRAGDSFAARFWYPEGGYLYDLVDGHGVSGRADASLRPNQIIAAALPDCPLPLEQRRAVVDTVAKHLWTPRGLRTLAPGDPRYQGRYTGDPWSRDRAYHQGTVWPWLLGPFVDAHLLAYGDKAAARRFVEPLREHLFTEAGIGSISEIFDADPPHTARGCIAQAWSVAEVFRAWLKTEPHTP
ncbi:MAG TPA: amylo-alpha-1,6-glucosidase [Chloroflexota bacterium]|nr:amylo-alpha-1,6-glucosidase [Chloroflexota bacterium]